MSGVISINLVEKINQILPQTQCTRCGYPSCKEYALAISEEKAEINQCPPGGDAGIEKLAKLLNKPKTKLNPLNGKIEPRKIAVIDEDVCIGCTLCIKACPVDAILGTNKMMHTIIAKECTGCDLCVPACPVDCITMHIDKDQNWTELRKNTAKIRFDNRNLRLKTEKQARNTRLSGQSEALLKRDK